LLLFMRCGGLCVYASADRVRRAPPPAPFA
jgi:hypothetical protein